METSDYGYEDKSVIINEGDGRHTVERWHADAMCVFTILLMFAINGILTWNGKPKSVKADIDFWKWRNIFISWVHGLIVGPWEVLCIWWYPELMQDPVFFINNFIYLLPPVSVGYFIYDFLDLLINHKLKSNWEVVLHHVIMIGGLWYNWTFKLSISYCIILLLAEINTIFLHLRKLLQFAQVGFDSVLYRVTKMINIFTFIFCRLLPQSMVVVGLFIDYHRVPKGYFLIPAITVPIGFTINIVLFWRILKTDVIRAMFGKRKKAA